MSESRTSDDADLNALRDLYGALGPGFPLEAQRVFEGDQQSERDEWCIGLRGRMLRCFDADELSSDEIFGLPAKWELTKVEVYKLRGRLTKSGDVVKVMGHLHCRPRGSWDSERFPFLHLWTMCAGRALRLESFFDGLELRRKGVLEGCPAIRS
jgi:hypothetical protein